MLSKLQHDSKYPNLNLRGLIYFAPWNEPAVSQLIASSGVDKSNFLWCLNDLDREFPVETLISLLESNPGLITLRILLRTTEFLKDQHSFSTAKQFAELLCRVEDFDINYSPNTVKFIKFINKLGPKLHNIAIKPFTDKINEALSVISNERYSEACILLALALRSSDRLQPEVAKKIVTAKLQGTAFRKDELLEIASVAFDRLDTELVRTQLIEPTLQARSFDILYASLPSILLWPHFEGEKEQAYTTALVTAIEEGINRQKLIEVLTKLQGPRSEHHVALFNQVSDALTKALLALKGTYNPETLLRLTQAYSSSSMSGRNLKDLIVDEFATLNLKSTSRINYGIHSALIDKELRCPTVSQSICEKIVNDSLSYRKDSRKFVFELAEAEFMKEPWAAEALQKVVSREDDHFSDIDVLNTAFALSCSGASLSELEGWVQRLSLEKYPSFLKQLVRDYLRQQNSVSKAVEAAISYEQFNPCHRVFHINDGSAKLLAKYLESTSVTAKVMESVDGLQVPVYLPSLNTAVWPLTSRSYFDDMTMKGSHRMYLDMAKARGLSVVTLANRQLHQMQSEEVVELLKTNGLVL
jgi:hypothetical protein